MLMEWAKGSKAFPQLESFLCQHQYACLAFRRETTISPMHAICSFSPMCHKVLGYKEHGKSTEGL